MHICDVQMATYTRNYNQCHRFDFPFPCRRPLCTSSGASKNPPSSSAFRAAWLMCLKRSGPKWMPPKYRVTMTSTFSTSCEACTSVVEGREAWLTNQNLQQVR